MASPTIFLTYYPRIAATESANYCGPILLKLVDFSKEEIGVPGEKPSKHKKDQLYQVNCYSRLGFSDERHKAL